MASLLKDGKYSDLTIVCGERSFPVHRGIVCPASKFFAAACDGGFKETQDSKISLPDDDPDAIYRMLKFLYTADYEDRDGHDGGVKSQPQVLEESALKFLDAISVDDNHKESEAAPTPSSLSDSAGWNNAHAAMYAGDRVMVSALSNNILIYALADKYDIEGLGELSQTKFEIRSADEWEVEDILTILPQVYKATPSSDRGLRDIILKVCSQHMDGLMMTGMFRQILLEDNALSFEILEMVHQKRETGNLESWNIRRNAARYAKIKEWAQNEEKLLKEIMKERATCRFCAHNLDLIITNGSSKDWSQPISIRCRSCRGKYSPK
ncbi:MAG: hypothetical protein Q9222_005732 [Ikaeria aurantiellina]